MSADRIKHYMQTGNIDKFKIVTSQIDDQYMYELLNVAVERSRLNIINYIITKLKQNEYEFPINNRRMIHGTLKSGRVDILKTLVDRGIVRLDTKDYFGIDEYEDCHNCRYDSSYGCVCYYFETDMLKYMIKKGANIVNSPNYIIMRSPTDLSNVKLLLTEWNNENENEIIDLYEYMCLGYHNNVRDYIVSLASNDIKKLNILIETSVQFDDDVDHLISELVELEIDYTKLQNDFVKEGIRGDHIEEFLYRLESSDEFNFMPMDLINLILKYY